MSLGTIKKHKKPKTPRLRSLDIHVQIASSNAPSAKNRYWAKACFKKATTAAAYRKYERKGKKFGVNLRCGVAYSTGPTKAVKLALRSLSNKLK